MGTSAVVLVIDPIWGKGVDDAAKFWDRSGLYRVSFIKNLNEFDSRSFIQGKVKQGVGVLEMEFTQAQDKINLERVVCAPLHRYNHLWNWHNSMNNAPPSSAETLGHIIQ